ncbi:DUF3792 family protein (plasmid) [Pontibacillus sp. ALD_SL1]|uniref:DUF3792 family protein n=1 Tax=Pontibacillus sp. ALD_SL1 TaxID=2777185 RepID=UPI001A963280|nr:DUF3792 family protein [Pontibacillus sp. ALD_SL1]QST02900.1 DUF3792 family protein [Pontibacillus sp. ALD_SL1]
MFAALNIIARGIILNLFLNMLALYGLIHYNFSMHYQSFTILLLILMMVVAFFSGYFSKKQGSNPKLNGAFIGIGSIYMILLFLYQSRDMDIATNLYLVVLWILIGFFSGWIGSTVPNKKA